MSRSYNMLVRVHDVAPEKVDRVKKAANDEWDFDDWHEAENILSAYADDYLSGGKTEEEFAEQLAKAIWVANGGYCEVEVVATYLENLPCETYSFYENDFQRLTTVSPSTS